MNAHSGKAAIVTGASTGIGRASTADPPARVAAAVVLAATAVRPRRRYPTGKIARQIGALRRLAPSGMFDKSLRRQMRLPA